MSEAKQDYRILYADIRFNLNRDDFDIQSSLIEVESQISEFDQNLMSSEQSHTFINSHLPQVVRALLDKKCCHLPLPVTFKVNELLKKILILSIKQLKAEQFGTIEMIKKILDEDRSFYENRYTYNTMDIDKTVKELWEKENDGNEEAFKNFLLFASRQTHATHNMLFKYNLSVFIRYDGFKKVVEFIKDKPHPTVDQIHQFITILNSLHYFMDSDMWRKIAKDFKNEITETLLNLSGDELRLAQKQDLQHLINGLETMLEKCYCHHINDQQKIGKILENFELELGIRCLRSPYLEKKLHGINEIDNKITQARHRDEEDARIRRGGFAYRSDFRDTARWLTTEKLLQWLDSQNILELIFGPSSHPEIVKRSVDLIRLLYTNHRFTREQIDLVWSSASNKHEADKDAIMSLIQDVIPCFSVQDLQYFFHKLWTLPYPQIDGKILSLIKSITKHMSSLKISMPRHGKSNSYHGPNSQAEEFDLWTDNDISKVREHPGEFTDIDIDEPKNKSNNIDVNDPWKEVAANDPNLMGIQLEPEKEDAKSQSKEAEPENTEDPENNVGADDALDFLWSICQENALANDIPKGIPSQALQILQELLTNYFHSERQKFMIRCVENIHQNSVVLSSIQLLESLLNSYSPNRMNYRSSESRDSKIQWLAKEHQLISDIYINLIMFKQQALDKAQIILNVDDKPEQDTNSTCSSGDEEPDTRKKRYEIIFNQIKISKDIDLGYIEEIKKRLDFLKYLYLNSPEKLHPTHIEILWDALILNATTESEYEECFSWLASILPHWPGDNSIIDDDMIHLIYAEKILKLDPKYYSPAAFNCFEKYFSNVNKQHGLLDKTEWSDYDVKDIGLLGMQALWELILQVKNESVYKDAQSLLKKLYKGLRRCGLDIQEDFLKKCMEHIRTGAEILKNNCDIDAANRVSRSLSLLYECIEDFEGRDNKISHNLAIEVQIDNQTSSALAPKLFHMALYKEMTIQEAKYAIAKCLNPQMSPENLQIVSEGREFDSRVENLTVTVMGIDDKSKIVVLDKIETIQIDSDSLESLKDMFPGENVDILKLALQKSRGNVDEAVSYLFDEDEKQKLNEIAISIQTKPKPQMNYNLSNTISNTHEYFNLLFELFELGNLFINAQIWSLLTKIPINLEMYEGIKNLNIESEASWNDLFDSKYMNKLLYSLQIVNTIIVPNHELSRDEFVECVQWRAKFVDLGGFLHIYKILIDSDHISLLSEQYQTNSKCIGFLLIIIKSFLESALANINSESFSESKNEEDNMMDLDENSRIKITYKNISTAIISTIDFPTLIIKLLSIIEINMQRSQEAEAAIVIENALQLLYPLIVYKPTLLLNLYACENLKNIIISGLLECQNESIRGAIKNKFSAIAQTITEPIENIELPRNYLLNILISNLPSNYNFSCDEYFELLNELIYICNYTDINLLNFSLNLIYNREIIEDRTLGIQDKVLTGHLNTATLLVNFNPDVKASLSGYLDFLYSWLFEIPKHDAIKIQNGPPKFKHQITRKSAFSLILALCSKCQENINIILMRLCQNHPDNKNCGTFDSEISVRSQTGYVGLKNYGSTCYMNSLMQQFFMIPQLKQGILESKISTQEILEDNLLYQFQLLIANLSESEKQYYEPRSFCRAFKGYDGQSMNVSLQQDVDEFFNLLLDKLEELMKPTKQAKLFRNTIGGTLVHEIVSCEENFPYKGEREEQFLRISLEIKNKKNIAEALDLFIKEDLLEGDNKYFCDQYDQKITAKKRCLINSMSNTVIIHLKRFEFDLTRMVRCKINDFCEFPIELNLKQWTKDGIENSNTKPDSYYQYELKGVLVHSGSADSGHYYSFIKDRNSGRWFKFDDRNVENFNINNLKDECFGGENNYVWASNNQMYHTTKSAYMLIYERINPLFGDIEEDMENEDENYQCKTAEILNKIWLENMEFQRDLLYFDEAYFDFVKKFVEMYGFGMYDYSEIYKMLEENPSYIDVLETQDLGLQLIKLITLFAYEILIRSRNFQVFCSWIEILKSLYHQHNLACLWFVKYLTQNTQFLNEILFECRESQVRHEFSELFAAILIIASKLEKNTLYETETILIENRGYESFKWNSDEKQYNRRSKSITGRFIELYLTYYLQEARKNWRRFNEFFNILKKFVNEGSEQVRLVVEKDGIIKLLSFYMNGSMPFPDSNTMGDQAIEPNLDEILEIIKVLICGSRTQSMANSGTYPPSFIFTPSHSEAILDSKTEGYFQDHRIFKNLINNIRNETAKAILTHFSWENISMSAVYIEEIVNKIVDIKNVWHEVNPYLKELTNLFTLHDSIKKERVSRFLNVRVTSGMIGYNPANFFEWISRYKEMHVVFIVVVFLWWGDMLTIPHIIEVAQDHATKFKWIVPFINTLSFRYLTHNIVVDYKDKPRSTTEDLKKMVQRFDIPISSDSESSCEIEFEPEDLLSKDNDVSNSAEPEPAQTEPKEEKEEDSTGSDEIDN